MIAFRKGLITCMGIWLSKLRGTLQKEAFYNKIELIYNNITYNFFFVTDTITQTFDLVTQFVCTQN